ncbi:hypothetical protein BS50DRAFT_578494 [Corynespora cassiicola Philippines]|uniref:Uncharacterized protein n=1 Tax=Corynespora cassiicola Philippines TaxID=1448308 RepID=A0A2T2N8D8_CORCC|nr:hypothetical protein BS50DRAFT_578494 [Corynespora cassiicola Philippines]
MPPKKLFVYMLPHRHEELAASLYGAESGSGERKIKLQMQSIPSGIDFCYRVTCHYDQNVPALRIDTVSKYRWDELVRLTAAAEQEIILSEKGSDKDYIARLTALEDAPSDEEQIKMELCWEENDELALIFRRGRSWIAKKVSHF